MEDRDLGAVEWGDVPAERMLLRRCVLADGNVGAAVLTESEFDRCTFQRCRFAAADLGEARFGNCIFFDAEEKVGCDFSFARLEGATFEGCNISLCRFGSSTLFGATFKGCKAAGADFEAASFSRQAGRKSTTAATFRACMLDMASFQGDFLDRCDFSESSLRGADFSAASLHEASFRGCELTGANIAAANLNAADLREATLDGVDLGSARSFQGIKVSRSQLPALAAPLGIRVFPD